MFGWSADDATSKTILSDFYANGGNFVDTADVYSEGKSGNSGGDSEMILGTWMKESGISGRRFLDPVTDGLP